MINTSLEEIPSWIINSGIAGVAIFLGYKIAMRLIDQLDAMNKAIDHLSEKITEVCTKISGV